MINIFTIILPCKGTKNLYMFSSARNQMQETTTFGIEMFPTQITLKFSFSIPYLICWDIVRNLRNSRAYNTADHFNSKYFKN